MQNKSVQIPYELFFQLLQYFLMDNYDGEEIIRLGLEKKLDAMVNREVYSKSKTAPTEEEREKFRQEYLDRKQIRRMLVRCSRELTGVEENFQKGALIQGAPAETVDERRLAQ